MFSFAGGRFILMTSCRIVVPRFGRAKFVFWLDETSPCYRLVDGTELIPGFVVSHYLRIIPCHQFGAGTTKFMSKESCYRVWNELSFFNLTALCHQLPQFFYQKISKNCICESPALYSALFRTTSAISKRERKNLRLETLWPCSHPLWCHVRKRQVVSRKTLLLPRPWRVQWISLKSNYF